MVSSPKLCHSLVQSLVVVFFRFDEPVRDFVICYRPGDTLLSECKSFGLFSSKEALFTALINNLLTRKLLMIFDFLIFASKSTCFIALLSWRLMCATNLWPYGIQNGEIDALNIFCIVGAQSERKLPFSRSSRSNLLSPWGFHPSVLLVFCLLQD